MLLDTHHPHDWARVIGQLLRAPGERARLADAAVTHARQFSWSRTACGLLAVYRDAVAEHRTRLAELVPAR